MSNNLLTSLLLSKELQDRTIHTHSWVKKIKYRKYNIVIPSYKEGGGIFTALAKLSKIKEQSSINIFVINYDIPGYVSCKDIDSWIAKNQIPNIYVISEKKINPTFSCIGQARGIGFFCALVTAFDGLKDRYKDTYLISCDADLEGVDSDLICKLEEGFKHKEVDLISYPNLIPIKDYKNSLIYPFKVFEDEFFKVMFKPTGIVNGRAYAVRASTYVLSGGVNPTLALEDKEFGMRVNAWVRNRLWVDTFVINSARRLYKFSEGLDMNYSYEKAGFKPNQLQTKSTSVVNISLETLEKNFQQWAFGVPRNCLRYQKLSNDFIKNKNIYDLTSYYVNAVGTLLAQFKGARLEKRHFYIYLQRLAKQDPEVINFEPNMIQFVYGDKQRKTYYKAPRRVGGKYFRVKPSIYS